MERMPNQIHSRKSVLPRETTSPSPRSLEGKVVIVIGDARGIGEATMRLFAKHGAKVVITDVLLHCDVSVEEVAHQVGSTISRHGRLNVLFNNAGVLCDQSCGSRRAFSTSTRMSSIG
ncbi:hypothetical protein H6P81_010401 [Aristolochia fimbriata]|uniref:Uncharacterized protein n=1 Tax=Aristolochia fimbriata TaxID=158543 RepID=A0AAV7ES25_ARIFI|nr:hypothetical protein H6P81_010401 [Aristolochia fimbriata]